jgi:hypothetical protein
VGTALEGISGSGVQLIKVRLGAGGGGGGGSGWNDRGMWVTGTAYATNDVVQLGAGTSAGLYRSVMDANLNPPDTAIGWVQLSSYATWI